jgi:RNA polymerase sigma factor for flagellar operon FliA
MNSCQGLVRSIAWKIHCRLPPHVDLDDLIGYGQVGLAEAARDFDPGREVRFTTFAYYRIRGSIFDGLSKMNWFRQIDYHRGTYEQHANEILESYAGDSATSTLQEDVQWFRSVAGTLSMVYLFSSFSSGGVDAVGFPQSNDRSPDESAVLDELRSRLLDLIETLPDNAKQLIRGAYFEGLTLKEAGERIGISKAWASRLHAKTLKQLAGALQ